ncbi:MAG: hypothetical protein AB8G22_25880 [Saprospiraceae bacterium]
MNLPRLVGSALALLVIPFCAIAQCENDTQFPIVNCLNGIAVNLAPNGMLTLTAAEIDANSTDNCTAASELQFSFSQDVNDQTRTFGCDDLGTIDLELWVTDAAGNQDFCTSFLALENAFSACDGGNGAGNFIEGCITNMQGDLVEEVTVDLYIRGLEEPILETDINGCYTLQLPDNENLSGKIVPNKTDDVRNGVTTFDLVVARKHILTIEPFISPYQYLAADANGSGSVTTFDLVKIRKVILNLDDEFEIPNWQFIPADYEFSDATNPFAEEYPTSIEFGSGINSVDFIAIKTGDLNGSANVSDAGSTGLQPVEK